MYIEPPREHSHRKASTKMNGNASYDIRREIEVQASCYRSDSNDSPEGRSTTRRNPGAIPLDESGKERVAAITRTDDHFPVINPASISKSAVHRYDWTGPCGHMNDISPSDPLLDKRLPPDIQVYEGKNESLNCGTNSPSKHVNHDRKYSSKVKPDQTPDISNHCERCGRHSHSPKSPRTTSPDSGYRDSSDMSNVIMNFTFNESCEHVVIGNVSHTYHSDPNKSKRTSEISDTSDTTYSDELEGNDGSDDCSYGVYKDNRTTERTADNRISYCWRSGKVRQQHELAVADP